MNLSIMSENLTDVLTKELDYSEEKKEIITYAIETALLFLLGTLLIIISGYAFNALIPSMIAAASGSLLRRVSGGAHFDSASKCMAFGAIIYSSIGVLAQKLVASGLTDNYIYMLFLLISFLIVSILAPVASANKPIHSQSLRLKLKISSVLFIIILFLMISFADSSLLRVSAVLGVFYQSITLLPIFNRKGGV